MSGIILSMEVEAVKYVLASHSTSKQTHTAYEQTNIWWSSITVSRNSAFIVKTSFLVYSAKSIGSLFSFSFYRSFNMAQCFVWNYYSSNHKRAQSLISIWKQKKKYYFERKYCLQRPKHRTISFVINNKFKFLPSPISFAWMHITNRLFGIFIYKSDNRK